MTPFELMNTIDKEISSHTPKLSAAINKALLYHGEASSLVGLDGKSASPLSFEESECLKVKIGESAFIMMKVMTAASLLESHSTWRLISDTRPADKSGNMELRYTLIRDQSIL